MASLFISALQLARLNHSDVDVAPVVLPIENKDIPAFLAQLNLCTHNTELLFAAGVQFLRAFTDKDNSTSDLQTYLPCFADFFGYIF